MISKIKFFEKFPTTTKLADFCDVHDIPEDQSCVWDINKPENCSYASQGIKKADCKYWRTDVAVPNIVDQSEIWAWIEQQQKSATVEPSEETDRYPLQSLGCQKIKGNCLCHRCHPDVKDLMSYCSGTYIAHGKPVKQAAIYQTLRESGNTHEPAEIIARIDQLIETKIVQKNEMYFTVALESAISALDNNAPMPTAKQGGSAVNWGET